jgi:chromosome segregation ATPase
MKSSWFSINTEVDINDTNNDKKDNDKDNDFNIFEIDSDKIIKKIEMLEKKVSNYENIYNDVFQLLNNLRKDIEKLENENNELKERINIFSTRLKSNETSCNSIKNDNLKLINRILEAEISVERTTNILLRKHISFPFTPLSNKFNL